VVVTIRQPIESEYGEFVWSGSVLVKMWRDEQALVAMESAHTAAASRFMNTGSPDFREVGL
jgi:hypothetical protein